LKSILTTFLLLLFSYIIGQTNLNKKEFVLIENLNTTELTDNDKSILDSCLTLFHNSKIDSVKINSLGYICDNLMHNDWKKFQHFQYNFILKKIKGSPAEVSSSLIKSQINALTNLGIIELEESDYNKALFYYNKSLKISQKNSFKSSIARSYSGLGLTHQYLNQPKIALTYYTKSYEMYTVLNDQVGMAENMLNIGELNRLSGNTYEASTNYKKSIKIYQKLNRKYDVAVCLNNMALIEYSLGKIPKAIELYSKSFNILNEIGAMDKVAVVNSNLADLYLELGEKEHALKNYNESLLIYQKFNMKAEESLCLNNIARFFRTNNELDSAISYYNKSLTIERSIENKAGIARCYLNLGYIFHLQKKYNKALEITFDGLDIFKDINLQHQVAICNINLATTYLEINQLTKAKKYGELGYKFAEKVGIVTSQIKALNILIEIAKKEKNYEYAFSKLEDYIVLRDSITNIENRALIIRKTAESDFKEKTLVLKKKELENELQIKNQKDIIKDHRNLTILILFIIILLIFIVLWRKSVYKIEITKLKETVLKSQMKPHFLFNVMMSIQNLVLGKKNDDAITFLAELSTYMRSHLNISSLEIISINEEIELTEKYLTLEKLRFKEDLNYTIINNLGEQGNLFKVSPFILQPLVENCIVHGFSNINYPGEITIKFNLLGNKVQILIEDNGSGFKDKIKTESKGINMVRKRLTLANSKNSLIIENKTKDPGVIVTITIHY